MAPQPEGLLEAAYALALLTFYVGVLLYALPLPWRGIKSWAPRLIADSIFAVILISAYVLLLEVSDEIPGYLGGSWTFLKIWFLNATEFIAILKAGVIGAYAVAKALGLGWVIQVLFWPLNRIADLALIVVTAVYGLSWLVQEFREALLALGLALYSIPFRIGRSAGAWLIAFTLVFYAGLPALPAFSSWLAAEPAEEGETGLGLAVAGVAVVDADGDPVDYGILAIVDFEEAYRSSDPRDSSYSLYILRNGTTRGAAIEGYASFPSMRPLKAVLELPGYIKVLEPAPFTAADVDYEEGKPRLRFAANDLLYTSNLVIAYYSGASANLTVYDDGSPVIILVEARGEASVTITWPQSCYIEYDYDADSGSVQVDSFNYEWRDVSFQAVKITINGSPEDPAVATITFSNPGCDVSFNEPSPKDYFIEDAPRKALADTSLMKKIFIYYITIPLVYIALLAAIAYSIARILGGRDRIMPRFL